MADTDTDSALTPSSSSSEGTPHEVSSVPTEDGARHLSRRRLLGGGLAVGLGSAVAIPPIVRAASTSNGRSGSVRRSRPSSIVSPAVATEQAVRVDPPDPPGIYHPSALHVALYGFPGSPVLGALGEQSVDDSVERVRLLAGRYAGFGRPVIPSFEILGSVASEFAGDDGDYSNEFPTSRFEPWVDAAAANGFHVLIDLQSGRSRFPDQAREYEELWRRPHVSMALDPEWRVRAPQTPGGGTIGTVDAAEVNETIGYLDELVRRNDLPTKLLVLHQFEPSMVTGKESILGTENVQVVMHMDGFGTLARKRGSWQEMVDDLPPGSRTGWKNFFDEDSPTPTPEETLANDPTPTWISYQ